jgi:hypothetical protein
MRSLARSIFLFPIILEWFVIVECIYWSAVNKISKWWFSFHDFAIHEETNQCCHLQIVRMYYCSCHLYLCALWYHWKCILQLWEDNRR